jgi:hypothetical protein
LTAYCVATYVFTGLLCLKSINANGGCERGIHGFRIRLLPKLLADIDPSGSDEIGHALRIDA